MSNARPMWALVLAMMAIFLVLLILDVPGNIIAGVLMLGCVVVIGTVIAAGLEATE